MRHNWLITAAALLAAPAAFAQGDAGKHTHDGFYLRGQFGLGYTRAEAADVDLAIKGVSGSLDLELGYAVFNNFIIYGKLFGSSVTNPDLEIGDETIEGGNADTSSNYLGAGAGITYYFMPANFYITGAVVVNKLSITEDGDNIAETDSGVGLNLGLGKEWWVSDNWGIGIGAEVALGRIRSKSNNGDDWNVAHFALLFTATYN
ncbi:porin family protein [Myxococcus sp. K15C18031901]|uniref:outer membrane beta-barrel protein n=1 Tax=Myxococcus dinghuensis TaxID=2906761 RepID=UPI0020A76E91|nr:outer membrane beta-barrel protein [Myxococcus dinghuensis]MCP3103743.1 porin family protein [Myxococcus dinghuensis]